MLKAPFPWFGGKSRAAHLMWDAFGDVRSYVEPFAGSLAVLLDRPDEHRRVIETVNDLDCHLVNFWRSVQDDPEAVIHAADYPVFESDLHARHRWLVQWMTAERRERFASDPFYCEPECAGWWLWGICAWIGGGWCERLLRRSPEIATTGRGVHAAGRRPQQGIHCHRSMPSLGANKAHNTNTSGSGIHATTARKRPMTGAAQHSPGVGVARATDWPGLIRALQERIRYVKVCNGNWSRVVTPAAMGSGVGTVGVLLDPPYSKETGRGKCYAEEDFAVAHEVRAWAKKNGENKNLRIALCGLSGEHDELEASGWRAHQWKSSGGMGRGKNSKALERRKFEIIWFSPHCLVKQIGLFDSQETANV